jgi:16S rRNA (guanine527-N7)-methyltransferase
VRGGGTAPQRLSTPGAPPDDLPPAARAALERIVELVAGEARAPSSVRNPREAWRVHVADSLSGLEVDGLREARSIADVGAGAGFPGLPLAVAMPDARVDLIEATSRKCEFIERAVVAAGVENARVICRRAEEWAGATQPDGGREAYEAVTARAVGRLATLAELASPLLIDGGVLVAWKGRRDPMEESEMDRVAARMAMDREDVRWVGPYAGSRNRHIHVLRKRGSTPAELPRRPGMAKKRPLGS